MPPAKKARASVEEDGEPSYLESVSLTEVEKPFKNPAFFRQANKRNKTLKQVLIAERERTERIFRARDEKSRSIRNARAAAEENEEPEPEWIAQQEKELAEEIAATKLPVTYHSIESPPSLRAPKKICDITGLRAQYTDPRTGLRYHNVEVYDVVKGLTASSVQQLLQIRGQGLLLK